MSLRERDRFDLGAGGYDGPPDPFDEGPGGGGGFPRWAAMTVAFLLGAITSTAMLTAPPLVPLVALAAMVAFVALAVRRRWR